MKTARAMTKVAGGLAALLAIGVAAGGCAGRGGSSDPGAGGGSGNGGGGPGGGTGGSTGPGGSGGSGGTPMLTLQCPAPKTGSPSLRLLTRSELVNTLGDVFPEVRSQWTAALPASTISPHGFDNQGTSEIGQQLAGKILEAAESVATAVTGSAFATILPCSTGAADRACAGTFLDKYGKRLFRRPLTAEERNGYLGFFDASRTKSDFKTALKWLTVALIQSPATLYRSEIGTENGGMRRLTPHEIVTELAYTYTGSTPSDALLSMADSGDIGDVGALARSLLQSDAGKRMLQKFFEQYVGYSTVPALTKPDIGQAFTQVTQDMVRETSAFIDHVVIQNGGGMKDLLTSPIATPSRALASYYGTGESYTGGFPMPASDYAPVTRPPGLGVGILAQGSFLSSHASSDVSSPTRRGLFVYYKLFCRPHLSVPDNVPQLDTTTPMPNINTTRDRFEKLHGVLPGGCSNCHTLFDPLGFAFEHFDEGGRYRAKENGFDINAAASAPGPNATTLTFTSQEDLMNQVGNLPIVHQCLSAYLATFAFGTDEACLGSSQVSALQAGEIGIAEAFARLATEPHFTTRNAQ